MKDDDGSPRGAASRSNQDFHLGPNMATSIHLISYRKFRLRWKTFEVIGEYCETDSPFIWAVFQCGWDRSRTTEGAPGWQGTVVNFVAVQSLTDLYISTGFNTDTASR